MDAMEVVQNAAATPAGGGDRGADARVSDQSGQQGQAGGQQQGAAGVGEEALVTMEQWQAALQELCKNASVSGSPAAVAAAAAAGGAQQAAQAYFANPIGGTPAYGLWSTQPLLTAYGAIPFFSGVFPGGYSVPGGNSLPASGAAAGKEDEREESEGIVPEGRNSGRVSKRAKRSAMQPDELNTEGMIAESPKTPSPSSIPANGVEQVACNGADGTASVKGGLTIDALAAAARAAALSSGTSSSDFWHASDPGMDLKVPLMDEKEIKKQRRKQSNRESARRSRLRKQQECENLHRQVKDLTDENQELKKQVQELQDLVDHYKKENKKDSSN